MPPFGKSFAAESLSEPWRLACIKAMGLEGWEDTRLDCTNSSCRPKLQVINLLQNDNIEDVATDNASFNQRDSWMQTAVQIQSNIREMASWIHQKQRVYVHLVTPDGEASLIQTTVTSFTATTASEIESLHQCVTSLKAQKQQHCAGIVQILMTELKEGIAEPFGRLSKQRQRAAVDLWQNPLQCRLWIAKRMASKEKDATLELLGFDDDDNDISVDQRFQPSRPSHRLHSDFWQSYETTRTVPSKKKRPSSLFRIGDSTTFESSYLEVPVARKIVPDVRPSRKFHMADFDSNDDNGVGAASASLQQEAVLLQAKTQNDLDSVQKMEQTMVDITALLSQFANLVSEQQEDVWEIHDATVSTKENLQKGQENLQDARERTAGSKHYMATAITAMGILLLLLNWLRA